MIQPERFTDTCTTTEAPSLSPADMLAEIAMFKQKMLALPHYAYHVSDYLPRYGKDGEQVIFRLDYKTSQGMATMLGASLDDARDGLILMHPDILDSFLERSKGKMLLSPLRPDSDTRRNRASNR